MESKQQICIDIRMFSSLIPLTIGTAEPHEALSQLGDRIDRHADTHISANSGPWNFLLTSTIGQMLVVPRELCSDLSQSPATAKDKLYGVFSSPHSWTREGLLALLPFTYIVFWFAISARVAAKVCRGVMLCASRCHALRSIQREGQILGEKTRSSSR